MSGLLCRQTLPAGPDGIRRRGSHLSSMKLRFLSGVSSSRSDLCAHHTGGSVGRLRSFKSHLVFLWFDQAACQASPRQPPPLASTGQIVLASLLVTAATTTLKGRRLSSSANHGQLVDRWDATIERAPCMSKVPQVRTDALANAKLPHTTGVPVCGGTRPIQAANSRALLNAAGEPMLATIAVDVLKPTPGISATVLQAGVSRNCATV